MAHNFEIQRQSLVQALRKGGVRDERVLSAVAATPRELFVEAQQQDRAYADQALPIGLGQTISQPLMVATMTAALQLKGTERVLEIGTGSGYQTAILTRLATHVYSIERHLSLAFQAAKRLQMQGLTNVSLFVGDGSLGWPDAAPYDRILVTAAAPEVPERLLAQLVIWGMLVIPVGAYERQELLVVHRAPWGKEVRSLGGCVFVPLVGQEGWQELP